MIKYFMHANRILHLETNPGNARALVQRHGERDVWINHLNTSNHRGNGLCI